MIVNDVDDDDEATISIPLIRVIETNWDFISSSWEAMQVLGAWR